MSYYVRSVGQRLVLTARSTPGTPGYEGPLLDLPPRMAATYLEALNATLDGEDLGAPDVRLDFTTRRRRPVLVMRWEGQTRQIVVDDEGASRVCGRSTDSIEGYSDPFGWTRALFGSLEPMTDDFIRFTAEESRRAEAIGEAVRRDLTPSELELDPEPVAENEKPAEPKPARRFDGEDRYTNTVEDAAAFEHRRADDGWTVRIGGQTYDVDDVPTGPEF